MNNIQTALQKFYDHLLKTDHIKDDPTQASKSKKILEIHLDKAAGINNLGWTIPGIRAVVLSDILLKSKDFVLKYQAQDYFGISDQDAKKVLAFLDKYAEEEFLVEEAITKLLEQHQIHLIDDPKLWDWIDQMLKDSDIKTFWFEYRSYKDMQKIFTDWISPLKNDDRKIIYLESIQNYPHHIYCEPLPTTPIFKKC